MHFAFGIRLTKTCVAVTVLAAMTVMTSGAEAKSTKKQRQSQSVARKAAPVESPGVWRTGTAAIMVDGNTGRVLYEYNADALRHPASLTKIMTLYLLFEQLEAGRLALDSDLPVSSKAAAQSPSKLNVRPGSTIAVEDAIKAIVTRSANDVAVVIGEAIGGSESNFADMMTRKARALGMNSTTFRNASGLPNPGQVTTARDLAILGRAIQDRFPREYRYFSTRSFVYRGETIGNHNRLLGRIEGVDGIKTGYTGASGFNLVTSVHRDNRFLIGVVLGGSSGGSRDARMASLVNDNLPRAYAGGRTAPKLTEVASRETTPAPAPAAARQAQAQAQVEEASAPAPLPAPQRVAFVGADPVTTAAIPQRTPAPGSAEPIKPVAVKTVTISRPVTNPVPAQTFNAPNSQVLGYVSATAPDLAPPADLQLPARSPAPQAASAGVRTAAAGPVALPAAAVAPAPPAPKPIKVASAAPVAVPASATRSGWIIQIGAFGGEKEARARLDLAKTKAGRVLGGADPYTEKVEKGASDIYRARFAGLSEKDAKEACRLLQRNDFSCMTLRH